MTRYQIKADILRRQGKRAKEIGFRLRLAREAAGVSQTEVSEVCGVTVMAVSRWELGDQVAYDEYLENAAAKLNVDFEWLRTGVGKPPVRKQK